MSGATSDSRGECVQNVGGLIVAVLGSGAMIVSGFLPLTQPDSLFRRIQSNTLVQQGGWYVPALGAVALLVTLGTYQAKRRSWAVFIIGIVALLVVVGVGNDDGIRTLYPIGANGLPNTSARGTTAQLGLAVYVAGGGAALIFLGGWIMRRGARAVVDEATRRCPDCAEGILAEAHVCRYCGYRFAHVTADEAVLASDQAERVERASVDL